MDPDREMSSSNSSEISDFDFNSDDGGLFLVSESGFEDEEYGEVVFDYNSSVIQPYLDEPEVQPPQDEEMEVRESESEIDVSVVDNW